MNPSWGKGNEWKKYADQVLGKDFFEDFKEFGLANQGPLVNIYENKEEIYCLINLPGVKNIEDVNLYVHYRTLKVTGNIDFSIKNLRVLPRKLYQVRSNGKFLSPFGRRPTAGCRLLSRTALCAPPAPETGKRKSKSKNLRLF